MNCRPPITERRLNSHGFTLVEVMISIALALLLILGISQIFGIAQRTTGAGTAVISSVEHDRGLQAAFGSDLHTMANGTDSPALVIASYSVPAFRNHADMIENRGQTGGQPDPLQFNDPSGTASLPTTGQYSQATAVNSRVHRLDRLCFFGRDYFTRQTADPSAPYNLTSTQQSREAFIWLGHLSLPNNAAISGWTQNQPGQPTGGGFFAPAEIKGAAKGNNDNNQFASDFTLGREVILLVPGMVAPPGVLAPPGTPPVKATLISGKNASTANPSGVDPLSLLPPAVGNGLTNIYSVSWNTKGNITNVTAINPPIQLRDSRLDVALTDIADYRTLITGSTTYWAELSGLATAPSINDVRYFGNPFVRKPPAGAGAAQWMSAAVAQSAPIFVPSCTQFIVEFAGDFVTQDSSGNVTAAVGDGDIDYVVENPGVLAAQQVRHIRWYGFPRDTNDDGVIDANHDVVPARDIGGGFLFERALPTGTPKPDYAKNGVVPFTNANPANGIPSKMSTPYVCAWGPDTDKVHINRPKMIRITLAIDDPAGHLNSDQTYSYIYNLP